MTLGSIGELYIGGVGLARGYLNKKDLTAQRFILNPFATKADIENGYTRLYKTGDLVRLLPDGNLEYIGRNDDQVKIRGYRIELGEIEHSINQIQGIKQSCVLARQRETRAGASKYLVGYYVLNADGATISPSMILDQLSRVLPEYMVPMATIEMASFPLTVNGKLDKRALPDPDFGSTESYVAPITEAEKATCLIWQQVLGVDQISTFDDFFRIGGSSIQAIQVVHRMNIALGWEVKVADIFKFKTINRILSMSAHYPALIKPYHVNYDDNLVDIIFVPPGRAGSEVYQRLVDKIPSKYNCIGIENYNLHNKKKIRSLKRIADIYIAEFEKNFIWKKPIILLGWSLGGQIALEMAAALEMRGFKNLTVFLLDTYLNNEKLDAQNNNDLFDDEKSALLRKYNSEYVEKVISAISAERELSKSPISCYLERTKVILFRATQKAESLNVEKSRIRFN